jgi:signal peptidase I
MTAHAIRRTRPGARRLGLTPSLRWLDRGSTAVCGIAVVALVVLLTATVLGFRPLIDYSGSMRPAIQAGDLLITRAEPATKIRIGQIVSFIDPALNGKLVTHRVVALHASAGRIDVVTRGDANSAAESWSVARAASVGTLDFRVPAIGRVIAWTAAPWARTALLTLAAFMLTTVLLRRIWRA